MQQGSGSTPDVSSMTFSEFMDMNRGMSVEQAFQYYGVDIGEAMDLASRVFQPNRQARMT